MPQKNQWQAVGALGGFIAGEQDELEQQKQEQALDLGAYDLQLKALKLQNEYANEPVREMERKKRIAQAQSDIKMIPEKETEQKLKNAATKAKIGLTQAQKKRFDAAFELDTNKLDTLQREQLGSDLWAAYYNKDAYEKLFSSMDPETVQKYGLTGNWEQDKKYLKYGAMKLTYNADFWRKLNMSKISASLKSGEISTDKLVASVLSSILANGYATPKQVRLLKLAFKYRAAGTQMSQYLSSQIAAVGGLIKYKLLRKGTSEATKKALKELQSTLSNAVGHAIDPNVPVVGKNVFNKSNIKSSPIDTPFTFVTEDGRQLLLKRSKSGIVKRFDPVSKQWIVIQSRTQNR